MPSSEAASKVRSGLPAAAPTPAAPPAAPARPQAAAAPIAKPSFPQAATPPAAPATHPLSAERRRAPSAAGAKRGIPRVTSLPSLPDSIPAARAEARLNALYDGRNGTELDAIPARGAEEKTGLASLSTPAASDERPWRAFEAWFKSVLQLKAPPVELDRWRKAAVLELRNQPGLPLRAVLARSLIEIASWTLSKKQLARLNALPASGSLLPLAVLDDEHREITSLASIKGRLYITTQNASYLFLNGSLTPLKAFNVRQLGAHQALLLGKRPHLVTSGGFGLAALEKGAWRTVRPKLKGYRGIWAFGDSLYASKSGELHALIPAKGGGWDARVLIPEDREPGGFIETMASSRGQSFVLYTSGVLYEKGRGDQNWRRSRFWPVVSLAQAGERIYALRDADSNQLYAWDGRWRQIPHPGLKPEKVLALGSEILLSCADGLYRRRGEVWEQLSSIPNATNIARFEGEFYAGAGNTLYRVPDPPALPSDWENAILGDVSHALRPAAPAERTPSQLKDSRGRSLLGGVKRAASSLISRSGGKLGFRTERAPMHAPSDTAAHKARRALNLTAWLPNAAFGSGALGLAWLMTLSGLPLAAALALPAAAPILSRFFYRSGLAHKRAMLEERGARALNPSSPAEAALAGEVASLARLFNVPEPPILVASPDSPAELAAVHHQPTRAHGLLLVHPDLIRDPSLRGVLRRAVLAHEMQHLRDARSLWSLPAFKAALFLSLAALPLQAAAAALGLGAAPLAASLAALLAVPASLLVSRLLRVLLERRADWGAVARLPDARAAAAALARLRAEVSGGALSESLGFPSARRPSSAAPAAAPSAPDPDAEKKPEFYLQAPPDWAARLAPDPGQFKSEEERVRYERELERLRPLARWMAHVHARLREAGVQAPPNLLTLQDLLDWAQYVRKHEGRDGWTLADALEDGLKAVFERPLPANFEGRDLPGELNAIVRRLKPVLGKLSLPKHLSPVLSGSRESPRPGAEVETLEEPVPLFKAAELGAMPAPAFILTDTVGGRYEDLLKLYSPSDHREKFFPLLVGPTGEGKSGLVKHMFADPEVRKVLGRAVPVVSIPVKEQMTRRELLGGLSAEGVEYGFLVQAAKNGWVLVLEELNNASGEFLKSLNTVLQQARRQGYFEFELGGATHRVQVHPHFWVVGTENPSEGNYAFTRNLHSPDFLKRWLVRHYDHLPPAEQAEILHGLSAREHPEDFLKRHGLDLAFFEKVAVDFHQPVRRLVSAGTLGGDNAEPYEFNKRTLLRWRKRFLRDLSQYEAEGRTVDERTRRLLLARELLEAYGSELRKDSERQALWDQMNSLFDLEAGWNIRLEDIQVDVRALYADGDFLVVEEALVSLRLPLRKDGGPRVPGASERLTLVPSLAANLYRALRNRQFKEHQLSSGPTGTAKTREQYFIAHLLGEPLFSISLDEQTPGRELHGGFLIDPKTGASRFLPGILARAMMHDPRKLEENRRLSPEDVRRSPDLGATLLVDEANASTLVETINPALDDGVLNLSDGIHSAVAGGGFHVVLAINPVGEGYAGFPLTEALRSRAQTVFHAGDMPEEEMAEILLDQLTGVVRYRWPKAAPAP